MSDLNKAARSRIRRILYEEADDLIVDLQVRSFAQDAVATGQTVRSLAPSVRVFSDGGISLDITGGEGWKFLEQGRGVTRNEGDGELLPKIKRWMIARGIKPTIKSKSKRVKGGRRNAEKKAFDSLAFAITRTIHKEGTLLHRQGKRRDIYSSVVTDRRINQIINKIASTSEAEILSDIIDTFK
jgi:hypothetical protein